MKKHFKTKWEDHLKRVTARVLTAVLTVTTCMQGLVFPAHAESYGKNGVVRDMTSWQIVDDMGLGYNIGNTFDSIGSWITIDDPWEYQRAWGNDPVSKHFIQKVRQAGFKTIRLPVSWTKWIDGNNQIDPGYMSAVQTVVDWCMEEDMYVILNVHHDSGAADNAWVRNIVTDFDGTSRKYAAVWTQIANNFANYGDHLIFEGMNEVEFPAAGSRSREYELLNHLNQLFVDTVRATGGNNAKRHLLIPGFNTDIKMTSDRRYHMPDDPAGRCILSIHYYSPSPFAVAEHDVDWCEPVTTWGSEEDIQAVRDHLSILVENFLGKGVPVIIGEYGVLTEDNKEKESIHRYVRMIPEMMMEYGMCPVLWDTSNAGDMKFIERNTGEFYDPQIRANFAELARKKANGQIARQDLSLANYKEVSVPISPGGWVSLESFDPSRILGIKFSLKCASEWDSYGGGGIWIDGWSDTPQYQFNSVFDEVTHLFTESERARLGDRLRVFLWWTDESKGGNRVQDLSFENGRVTLLYAEGEDVNAAGPYTNTGVHATGGGGGGGGGTSSRPNTSTNPGESGNQYGNREIKAYPNSLGGLSKDGYGCIVNIKDLCPDYELGDEVRLTIYPLTDDWASGAIEIPGLDDNGFGGNKQEFTFTPAQNTMEVKLWVTGSNRTYFRFAMRCEVTKKNSQNPLLVKNGEEKSYTWEELMELAGISGDASRNKKLQVTIATEQPDGKKIENVNLDMYKSNGVSFSSSLGSEDNDNTAGGTVTGAPRKTDAAVVLKNSSGSDILIKGIYVKVLDEEDDPDVLQKMTGGITNFRDPAITHQSFDGTEPQGTKIYFTTDEGGFQAEDFGGRLFVNDMGWDDGMEATEWIIRNDAGGSYIFVPEEKYQASVNRVWFSLWGMQDGFTVMKIVAVEKESTFAPIPVEGEAEVPLKEVMEESGIQDGDKVKMEVTVQTTGAFEGTVILKDKDGNHWEAEIATDEAGIKKAVLIGKIPADASITVKAGDDSATDSCVVTGIQMTAMEDDGSLMEIASSPVRGTLANSVIEQANNAAETAGGGEDAGIKIYYEYDGDLNDTSQISANLVINNDWGYGNGSWQLKEDNTEARSGGRKYIFYPCENEMNSLLLAVWYTSGKSLKITGVSVVKKEQEPDPIIPGGDKEYEVAVEADADGKYSVPDFREDKPIGVKLKATFTQNGANMIFDNWSSGSQWVNASTDVIYVIFSDGLEFSTLSFDNDTTVESLSFLYWEAIEGTKEESEDGTSAYYLLADSRVPVAINFSDYAGGNVNIAVKNSGQWEGYSGGNDYIGWTNGLYADSQGLIKLQPAIESHTGSVGIKTTGIPGKVTFYYNQPLEEATVFLNTEDALQVSRNTFRMPARSVPVGMQYVTSEAEDEERDSSSRAALQMSVPAAATGEDADEEALATPANAAVFKATASNASPSKATDSNWKTIAKKLMADPESEEYYEFTPAERNAIGSMLKLAEESDSEELPLLHFDLDVLSCWIEKLTLIFEPDEILDTDSFDDED